MEWFAGEDKFHQEFIDRISQNTETPSQCRFDISLRGTLIIPAKANQSRSAQADRVFFGQIF
jgi:hypothetical protein